MALTHEQKLKLARTYAPILIFHPEEEFFPTRPQGYIERASLWKGQPASDQKKDWGKSQTEWPRHPTIPETGISVDEGEDTEGQFDPDGDGVNEFYLGHRNNEGIQEYLRADAEIEHWLNSSAWADSSEVTKESVNNRCNKPGAIEKWREEGLGRIWSDWYHAEVLETSDFERMLISLGGIGGKPIDTIIREMVGEIWVVWYYFLYPIHEEYLRRCEQVFDSQWRGDYEGDWNAVAVVVQQDAAFPWETQPTPPVPLFVGYGARMRGLAKDIAPDTFRQGMTIRRWDQISRPPDSVHPRVFVTKGYHNNYSIHGDKDPTEGVLLGVIPLDRLTCSIVEGFDKVVNDIKEAADDVGETAKDIAVTLAKMVAGSGIGLKIAGPLGAGLGALAGIAAGVFEGLSTSNTDDVPAEDIRKALEREPGPKLGQPYGVVVRPDDVDNPLLPPDQAHPELTESAASIRTWLGSDEERLVDRATQIWWPTDSHRRGYDGRWGVRCENDPNNRRSGINFPDFRVSLLNDLAFHLASTDG